MRVPADPLNMPELATLTIMTEANIFVTVIQMVFIIFQQLMKTIESLQKPAGISGRKKISKQKYSPWICLQKNSQITIDFQLASNKHLGLWVVPEYSISSLDSQGLWLNKDQVALYTSDLERNGPQAGKNRKEQYVWFELQKGIIPQRVLAQNYQDRTYVLTMDAPDIARISTLDWASMIKSYSLQQDQNNNCFVNIEFTDAGKENLHLLTDHSFYQYLGLTINGEIGALVEIGGISRQQDRISGFRDNFTQQDARKIIEILDFCVGLQPTPQSKIDNQKSKIDDPNKQPAEAEFPCNGFASSNGRDLVL